MEWYIIIVVAIVLIIALALDFVVVTYYENPEDGRSNQGLVAKAVALLGFEICWTMLTLVPTDGFNANHIAGLDTQIMWQVIGPLLLLFLLFPIPFATSYYEADLDPRVSKTPPWTRALRTGGIHMAVGSALVVVLYFALRKSKMEYCPDGVLSGDSECIKQSKNIPFLVFPWLLLSFFGWFVVVLFLGVGLVSCPLGLIYGFFHRPRPVTVDEYMDAKIKLGEQAAALKMVGEELRVRASKHKLSSGGIAKLREGRAINAEMNKFRQSVHLLESEFEALNMSLHLRGENPFISYCKLTLGFISVFLSVLWVAHFVGYLIVPQLIRRPLPNAGVVNVVMQSGTKANFYALDLTVYLVFTGYLLMAMAAGCFRFNMRMFCCLSIHPMQKGKTHLNSLLFNCMLLLIGSSAIIHMTVDCLQHYMDRSFGDLIYLQYGKHMPVFGFFFKSKLFYWALLLWSVVCLVVLSFKPNDSKAFSLKNLNKLRKRTAGSTKNSEGRLAEAEHDVENVIGKAEKVTKVLF